MPTQSYTGSKAAIGLGSILSVNTGTVASPTWTIVGEIKTMELTGRQAATEDVTNMQSTGREFIPTLIDYGSWKITGSRVGGNTGQIALESAFQSLSLMPFEIQCPLNKAEGQTTTGDLFTFTALVQDINYSLAVDKVKTFTATLKISGAMTLTAGS